MSFITHNINLHLGMNDTPRPHWRTGHLYHTISILLQKAGTTNLTTCLTFHSTFFCTGLQSDFCNKDRTYKFTLYNERHKIIINSLREKANCHGQRTKNFWASYKVNTESIWHSISPTESHSVWILSLWSVECFWFFFCSAVFDLELCWKEIVSSQI